MNAFLSLIFTSYFFCNLAFAGSINLFTVRKPISPENLIQVDALVTPTCGLQGLDFYYLMNGVTPKRSWLEGSIRKLIPIIDAVPGDRAACAPGSHATCQNKFVKLPFLDRVIPSNPPLVVRAEKKAGKCETGGYLDLGGEPVNIKRVIANGQRTSLNVFTQSATIRIDSIVIDGNQQGKPYSNKWKCSRNCETTVSL